MNKRRTAKYIIIAIAVLVGVFSIGYALLNNYYSKLHIEREDISDTIITTVPPENTTEVTETETEEEPAEVDDVTIFLMGTDSTDYLTDTMLIVNADLNTDTISMFSIPRDYRVELTSNTQNIIGFHKPAIKLTEIHSYATVSEYKSPPSVTASVVEDLVGLEFDYIVLVNLKAFREAVDAIGGVDLYLPRDYNYDDPYQDLSIHFKQGWHHLDGSDAEKVVRFRQSNDGDHVTDFNRIEMQQYFLKEFIKKFISIENTINIPEIFTVIEDNVKTDAELNDVLYLASQAPKFSMERVYAHTLPGEHAIIDNIYYYNPPTVDELHDLVALDIKTDRSPTLTSKNYDIKILNGSNKNKIATTYQKILEEDGYTVTEIGDSGEDKLDMSVKTRIYVPQKSLGKDLQSYFELSEIIYDEDAEDITIIIGKLIEE